MKDFKKWIDKNISSFENKNVFVLGATGSIGKELVDALLYLKANVYVCVRNLKKGEKLISELKEKYINSHVFLISVDFSKSSSVLLFAEELKKYRIDYLVSCVGVYHLDKKIVENDMEIHFATNYYNQILLIDSLEKELEEFNTKVVFVSSISHRFYNLNYSDLMSLETKNKTKVYARSKRLLNMHLLSKIRNKQNIVICHPGVSPTSLFASEKGGFSVLFNKTIFPLMKIIFISPRKAMLNILFAMENDVKYSYQVGPKGLFHIWGYPKIYKFSKRILNNNEQEKIVNLYMDRKNKK